MQFSFLLWRIGFCGAISNGTTNGLFLDDPFFLPVFEALYSEGRDSHLRIMPSAFTDAFTIILSETFQNPRLKFSVPFLVLKSHGSCCLSCGTMGGKTIHIALPIGANPVFAEATVSEDGSLRLKDATRFALEA